MIYELMRMLGCEKDRDGKRDSYLSMLEKRGI